MVSIDTIHIALFVAMLNGLKVCAADISSAYLTAFTLELKWTILGPEFGPEWARRKVKIDKALYGLIGSCSSFHRSLCVESYKLGFKPSKADADLWMHEAGNHYEYIGK